MKLLHDHAREDLKVAIEAVNQAQVDSAKERTQFFEKLAIGSGATIAAIVSFLGAHSQKLHPTWIFRTSLVLLVLVIFFALYRNLRYQTYLLAVRELSYWDAAIEEQESRRSALRADPGLVVDFQSGNPLDVKKIDLEIQQSSGEARKALEKKKLLQERRLKEWRAAEKLCVTAVCVTMVSLVWLAIANF